MKSLYFGYSKNIAEVYVKVSTKSLSCMPKILLKWVLREDSWKNVSEMVVGEKLCRCSYVEFRRYQKCICSGHRLPVPFHRHVLTTLQFHALQFLETIAIKLPRGTFVVSESEVIVTSLTFTMLNQFVTPVTSFTVPNQTNDNQNIKIKLIFAGERTHNGGDKVLSSLFIRNCCIMSK